jgi:hypothetical protein
MSPRCFSILRRSPDVSLIILMLLGATSLLAAVLCVSPVFAKYAAAAPNANSAQMQSQPTLFVTGTISAGQVQSVEVPVASATTASLRVMALQPVAVTLVDPAGGLIDASTPASNPQVFYDVMEPDAGDANPLWYYQYTIVNPADGLWQMQIAAEGEAYFEMMAAVESPLQLIVLADEGTYSPGATVTLEGGVVAEDRLQAGFTLSGTAQLPDGSRVVLDFYDDGANGDKHAGNNLYTAQFPAPAANGDIEILVQATKGSIARYTGLLVPVVGRTATIQGAGPESAIDANGNGYFDSLNIDVTFNVLEAGHYDVAGDLYSANGEKLADGVYTTTLGGKPLTTGVHTVTLSYDGQTLREQGVDGPYVLDHLQVDHHTAEFDLPMTVASARYVYTTTAYTANQFDGAALRILATGEGVKDTSGDGLYDSLTITATFDVLQPGLYEWLGILVAADGALVAQTEGRGQLGGQQPAVFIFAGGPIHTAGLDGPYTLTNVFVIRLDDRVANFYFDDLHVTAPYRAAQFSAPPTYGRWRAGLRQR